MQIARQAAPAMLACAALAAPVPAAAGAPSKAAARFAGPVASAASHSAKAKTRRSRGKQSCKRGRSAKRSDCRRATRTVTPKTRPTHVGSSAGSASGTGEASAQSASIAEVLATPCQNTSLTPTPANLPIVRAAVLCLINTERAQHGEPPLQANRRLEAAAESHGREMLAVDYFDHVSPSGITPVDRVREAGYIPNSEVGYVVGENLAWGTLSLSTPEAIVNAWIASPEHLANILESKYRDTGIDVRPEVPKSLSEGVEGGLYTQEFGVIVR